MERIFLIENNSELGAGTRGASLGIPALRIAALNRGSEIFDDYQRVEIEHHNDLLWRPVRTQFAKRVEGIVRVYERLSRAIGDLVEKDYFPVVLAGDHSSAGGTIAGLAAAYPESRLGVIWIDAHADLHTPYTTPSGNVHGMPLATALGVDNKEEQTNDPSEDEVRAWESLKWVGGLSPKIYPEDLFFLGVRDTETPEDRLMEREHIPNITVPKSREIGLEKAAQNALDHLKDCDIIYVSFDVDSMDPDLVSYGTGTPVKGGFSPDEIKSLLTVILQEPKVKCFEIVEINPCLDNKCNTMAETALDILEHSMEVLEQRPD